MGNVLRDVIAANGQDHGVPDVAVHIDCQIGGTTANVTDGHTHLTFLLGEDYFAGGQWIQHELLDLHTRRAHTLAQVIYRRGRSCDDVRFHFEPIAMHTLRIANPILSVHTKAALDHMDDFAIMRDGHG